VFKAGLTKDDNFFAGAGDFGSLGISKLHKEGSSCPNPTAWWPASSPYVVAVGGTQLQYGWTWNPSSNDAFTAAGDFNPAYWAWTNGGNSQAVWNESWAPIATGGGASVIYARPSWQQSVDPIYGDHRLLPDTAWNAAVNGGVDVYITAYPQYNCGNTTGCSSVYGARRLQHRRPLRLSLWSTPPGPRRPRGPSGSSTPSCTTASARLITATSSRSTAVRPRPPSPAPRSA
jgi:hypothetical protein